MREKNFFFIYLNSIKMKNIIHSGITFLIFFTIFLQSCEKEPNTKLKNELPLITTEYFDHEVKKEISFTDKSGQNTAYYIIYAEDQEILENFLNFYDFTLMIDSQSRDDQIIKPEVNLKATSSQITEFNLNLEPQIYLKLVYADIESKCRKFSVALERSTKKGANYITGYPIGWSTVNGDFLGTVHRGFGSEYYAKWRYKEGWLSFVKDYTASFFYPSSLYYGGVKNYYSWYRLDLIIYPDLYQTEVNYIVAYDLAEMRGHSCTIGNYDHFNCYVGTPPTGSTAFIYYYPNTGETWFMYTPVNGNQCPLSGSHFDGANCNYRQVPQGTEPFLYNNNWYVRPDIIEEFTYWK